MRPPCPWWPQASFRGPVASHKALLFRTVKSSNIYIHAMSGPTTLKPPKPVFFWAQKWALLDVAYCCIKRHERRLAYHMRRAQAKWCASPSYLASCVAGAIVGFPLLAFSVAGVYNTFFTSCPLLLDRRNVWSTSSVIYMAGTSSGRNMRLLQGNSCNSPALYI